MAQQHFPVTHPIIAVYLALTDGRGKKKLRLVLSLDDGDDILFEGDLEVDFTDPLAIMEAVFMVQNLQIPREGTYTLTLFADQEYVMARRITALKLPAGSKP